MTEFPGFPWKYGMDFSEGRGRVIAVRFGDGDIKSDLDWIGPVVRTAESDGDLGCWARKVLEWPGGYVHLFPADGDASAELASELEDEEDEEVTWP